MVNFLSICYLRFPGAGTIKLEMASSFMELSVGGGGHTKLSIMSTFLGPVEIGGGSGFEEIVLNRFSNQSLVNDFFPKK